MSQFQMKEHEENLDEAAAAAEVETKRIENMLLKDTWRSECCGGERSVSRTMVTFIMQGTITVAILCFCFFQLGTKNDEQNASVYFSLISALITLYVTPPAPGPNSPTNTNS